MSKIEPCLICNRVALCRSGENPYLIHEFEHSFFVVGDHQFHKGYSLVLFKEHVRELHELAPAVQAALFQEVMTATQAIVRAFNPWKMNHACYGNAEQHVHWHLFPRYDDLLDHRRNPWVHSSEFKNNVIDTQSTADLAQRIRSNLDHS
jgi:diadenosine tetraphosphate (Ap4A) HIT family hydrolase